ncbi:MAG: hypothetical protein ACE5FT_04810 [Candidatus Nanoarchaeia archaeon]
MVKHFLVTRPQHDRETSYLHSFTKPLVKLTKADPGFHISDLEGSKANRKTFENIVKKTPAGLIFLNGHGTAQAVWGHNDEPILDEDNIECVDNAIVFAQACKSLASLGSIAVDKGTKAYIGYNEDFMCIGDTAKSSVPDKDKLAAPFKRVTHVMIRALAKGDKAGKAVAKTKEEYNKLIKTFGKSTDPYGDIPLVTFALTWNLLHLGMKGDKEAVF